MKGRIWKVATVKATGDRFIVEEILGDKVRVMGAVMQRNYRANNRVRHETVHMPARTFLLRCVDITEEVNPTNLAGA